MKNLSDSALSRRLRALLRLAEAAAEADAAGVDRWQYAVTVKELHEQAVPAADVQRLVKQRLIERRAETTRAGARRRSFRSTTAMNGAGLAFGITHRGLRVVLALLDAASDEHNTSGVTPHWDPRTGKLTYGGALVKQLVANAKAQRTLLKACQDQGWPDLIENPFADMAPRRRGRYLSRLLCELNANQADVRVQFRSARDKGLHLCWKGRHVP